MKSQEVCFVHSWIPVASSGRGARAACEHLCWGLGVSGGVCLSLTSALAPVRHYLSPTCPVLLDVKASSPTPPSWRPPDCWAGSLPSPGPCRPPSQGSRHLGRVHEALGKEAPYSSCMAHRASPPSERSEWVEVFLCPPRPCMPRPSRGPGTQDVSGQWPSRRVLPSSRQSITRVPPSRAPCSPLLMGAPPTTQDCVALQDIAEMTARGF